MKQEKNSDLEKALELLAAIEDPTAKDKNDDASEKIINYKAVVEKEFDTLKEVIQQLEEQNLENVAKIQTMARRHAEENLKLMKYGGVKLAEQIIKPIDLFKKVLATPVQSPEVKNYLLGFEMIVKQLDQALTENGIQKIETQIGDEFNPALHNAQESVESTTVQSGQVVEVIADGYKMYDRVIVHTLVKVAK